VSAVQLKKSQNLYYHINKVVGYSNLWLNVNSNFVGMKKYGSLVEQNGKGESLVDLSIVVKCGGIERE